MKPYGISYNYNDIYCFPSSFKKYIHRHPNQWGDVKAPILDQSGVQVTRTCSSNTLQWYHLTVFSGMEGSRFDT